MHCTCWDYTYHIITGIYVILTKILMCYYCLFLDPRQGEGEENHDKEETFSRKTAAKSSYMCRNGNYKV